MAQIDKSSALVKHLASSGIVKAAELELAFKEHDVTHEDFGMILVRNGFIRQVDLVQAMLDADRELLYDDTVVVPGIPSELLVNTRTVIVAETEEHLYAATLGSEIEVASRIFEFDPRPITFVPMSLDKLDGYLDDLAKLMHSDEESLVDRLIRRALNSKVSDLHIIPREKTYTMLQRRLGVREWAHEGTLDEYQVLLARLKDRAKMDLSERRYPQDGSFQVEHHKRLVDMRVATSPTTNGEYVVIRLLDPDSIKPDLSTLGISRVDEWRKGINRSNGLCLICGPTGSGKTTTLNSSIREIDRISNAVFTVEDPVEYQTPFVGQVNVNPSVSLDFNRALKAFMRQDPDIIVTGEIRDEETSRITIKGAETGHVMIATLHTSSVHGAVSRLRDIGVPPHELKNILRTVLAQRLIRTLCKICKGDGCRHCNDSGYGGRTIVSECAYFPNEQSVVDLLEGRYSWPTMVQDALDKVEEGVTTMSEVTRVFGQEAIDEAEKREALKERGVAHV